MTETPPPHDKLVLVVVDDDEAVRRNVQRFLRSRGHDVRVFATAEAYLADHGHADCAILDIQLPGLNGLELERRMRRECSGVAVVFVTAHDDAVSLAAVKKTPWQLLSKPFDDESLLAAIAKSISLHLLAAAEILYSR